MMEKINAIIDERPLAQICYRRPGENFEDYFVRLFQHKKEYKLSCQEIANLLNKESGQGIAYSESKWRKEYAAFARGMKYVAKKQYGDVDKTILCISDTHVPFQLPKEIYKDYVGAVDILVFNGDICDCQAISKFPKAYRVSPMQEIIQARQYMIDVITYIKPREKVIVNYGNHDIRFQNYLAKNLDSDLIELMPKTSLELICVDGFNHYDKMNGIKLFYTPLKDYFNDDVEIEYTNSWYSQIGQTIFCHPIAFSSGMMKTSEKALQFFRNEGYNFTSLVMAHTHRVGDYVVGNTTLYEQGCCCDVKKQNYSDGRLVFSQKEGFMFICQDKDGKIIRDCTKIISVN